MWKEASEKFGKMESAAMFDEDVFSLFPGKWLTDQAFFVKVQLLLIVE